MSGNDELVNFFSNLKGIGSNNEFTKEEIEHFESIPILETQCLYVYDFNKNKIVFAKNAQLLGYENDELKIEHTSNYHPDDTQIINTVTKSSIHYGITESALSHGCCLSLTFRVKKKDGSYIHVLKQTTIYKLDENDRMTSNITILSDVSFINSPGFVNWSFKYKNLDSKEFEDQICGAIKKLFTKKELEIITLLIKGYSNKRISEELISSIHTISTHRRNIKKKSGCKNMYELMIFATRNKLVAPEKL